MTRFFAIAVLGLVVAFVSGCNDDDVGTSCPQMQVPSGDNSASTSGSQYPADVEVNTEFPCDSLTCVVSSGREPYCSRECVSDVNCPSAFTCSVLSTIGPLANRKFCVWRGCRAQLECGDVSKYDCIEGAYGPLNPPGLCGPLDLGNQTSGSTDTQE